MAVGAVTSEILYARSSLTYRVRTGKISDLKPIPLSSPLQPTDNSSLFLQIPYATEQGIFLPEQVTPRRDQGRPGVEHHSADGASSAWRSASSSRSLIAAIRASHRSTTWGSATLCRSASRLPSDTPEIELTRDPEAHHKDRKATRQSVCIRRSRPVLATSQASAESAKR